MVFAKVFINVVSVSIAEQRLCLLLFSNLLRNSAAGDFDDSSHPIESEVQIVNFFARWFVAQFDGPILFFIFCDLVKCLIQVNYLASHLLSNSLCS